MVKKNIRPTAGRPAGGGCNQRTQPPASTPSQDQRTQKRTRAQPSSATRRQLEDETARHQACMADAMELLEKRRNRKRKRSACANELDRMGSATIADHTVAYTKAGNGWGFFCCFFYFIKGWQGQDRTGQDRTGQDTHPTRIESETVISSG